MRLARASDGKQVVRFSTGLEVSIGNLGAGILLSVATFALAALSISVGATHANLWDLLSALFGAPISEAQSFALWDVRVPRTIVGFMVGWCVAMAGAILQSLARNPLADPSLFGLSQGSMVVIMLLFVCLPGAPRNMIPLAALAGGMAVAFLLLGLVGGRRASGLAILLMGIAIETVLSSVNSILILYAPKETSFALADWLAGSLFQASWSAIGALAPWFALSLPAAFFLGRRLRCYSLGEESAMALGEPVAQSRPIILLVAVLLSSAAVTAVGPLIFLGVMGPHLAAFISPASGRARLILSGLTGGMLVIGADVLTRSIGGDIGLPLGLSLTVVGVPLFIISLRLRALRYMQTH